jgi:hypothetical protein
MTKTLTAEVELTLNRDGSAHLTLTERSRLKRNVQIALITDKASVAALSSLFSAMGII